MRCKIIKNFLDFTIKVLFFTFFALTLLPVMKKTIYNKFGKEKIVDLPRVTFEGRIVLVRSEHEAEKAVRFLLSQPILGLDTETRQ